MTRPRIEPWISVTIGGNPKTPADIFEALKTPRQSEYDRERVKEMIRPADEELIHMALNHPDFQISTEERKITLCRITLDHFWSINPYNEYVTLDQIHGAGLKCGLKLCSPEVGIRTRLQHGYLDESDESLGSGRDKKWAPGKTTFAMKPVNGYQFALLDNVGNGRELSLECANPERKCFSWGNFGGQDHEYVWVFEFPI